MGEHSGEYKEEVTGEGIGESEIELEPEWGWCRGEGVDSGLGEALQNEWLVIFRDFESDALVQSKKRTHPNYFSRNHWLHNYRITTSWSWFA